MRTCWRRNSAAHPPADEPDVSVKGTWNGNCLNGGIGTGLPVPLFCAGFCFQFPGIHGMMEKRNEPQGKRGLKRGKICSQKNCADAVYFPDHHLLFLMRGCAFYERHVLLAGAYLEGAENSLRVYKIGYHSAGFICLDGRRGSKSFLPLSRRNNHALGFHLPVGSYTRII